MVQFYSAEILIGGDKGPPDKVGPLHLYNSFKVGVKLIQVFFKIIFHTNSDLCLYDFVIKAKNNWNLEKFQIHL